MTMASEIFNKPHRTILLSNRRRHKSELKHVLEMLKLEHQDLESLRQQHENKVSELDKTQRHLLDERSELDRLQMETQRRGAEVDRSKQVRVLIS